MNKTIAVREHLENKGHISSFEAITNYGATRLSAIIFNLRKKGMNINNEWNYSIDRYGNKVRYVDYTLIPDEVVEKNTNHIPFID